MNAELKVKWIAALRSGKYRQGLGRLRGGDNSYCCLGVLCDVRDSTAWNGNTYTNNSVVGMAKNLLDEVGISQDVHNLLAAMNDEDKQTFPDIADWIEENL
jgi:hypothetical protein